MRELANSKADIAVTNFFSRCMMDPEINLGEFVEAVSISLGSTVALRIKEGEQGSVLEQTIKRVRMGSEAAKKLKPAADILRARGIHGVHVVIIQRE